MSDAEKEFWIGCCIILIEIILIEVGVIAVSMVLFP